MVHKHEKGSGSVAKRLLGLCLALVMLCGVFVPTFASVAGVDGESQPQQEQTAEPTGGTDGKQDAEGQPTGGAEDANAGDDGEKKDDTENVSGDAKDESEGTGDTGDAKDENPGDVKDDTTGDGETKDEAKDESKDAKDEDVKDADESDAADANAANGIATYANVDTVTAANNTNIKVNMFNYTGKINEANGTKKTNLLFHNNSGAYPARDDEKNKYETSGAYDKKKMQKTLGNDGYPAYGEKNSVQSLKYLFDTNPSENIAGFTHYKAADNSGLFRNVGNGYLEYDSANNAAYFDIKTGTFTLYNGVVRPGYEKETGVPQGTNFLPFNDSSQFIKDKDCNLTPQRYTLGKQEVDLWFGMTVEFEFLMPENGLVSNQPMQFEFKGDDDVWVFIDDVLVLDIGGTHGAEGATINFKTGECSSPRLNESHKNKTQTLKQLFTEAGKAGAVEWDGDTFADFSSHTLKFFYLERGGNISYCKLRFNMPTLPSQALTIGKELTTDAEGELEEHLKQTYTYKFRVLKTNGTDWYIPAGEEYTLVDAKTFESLGQTGEVDENGYINLKAGQYAQFTDVANKYGTKAGSYEYIVEETLPDDLTGQYAGVAYTLSSGKGDRITGTDLADKDNFTGYRVGPLSATKWQLVRYNNVVATQKMGQLTIEKKVEGAGAPNDDFIMEVKLGVGDDLLPVPQGTPYTVTKADGTNTENKTVETAGQITLKAGEKATFDKILAGTEFTVKEVGLVDNDSYKFECEKVEGSQVDKETKAPVGTVTINETTKVASGTVGVNGAVSIVVTNKYTPKTTTVTVKKIVAGLLGDTSKKFNFAWHYGTSNGPTTPVKFELGHNGEMVLKDIPIGAVVTVKEDTYTGYVTTWENGLNQRGSTNTATLTVSADTTKNTITFTNTKDADPDTGVFLDSMPYIMALVIVAGGAAVFFLRRRKKSED